MRHRRLAVALAAALSLTLAACSSSSSPAGSDGSDGAASGDPILLGFPADLSSTYAYYDVPIKEGATMAIDEINAAGGVLGRPLKLDAVDQRNDAAESSKVTQEMIDEGAAYLIASAGDTAIAAGQLACAVPVPISTGDGTSPVLVGDMGDCAFQLVMNDTVQGAVIAEYALAQNYKTAITLGSPDYVYTANLPRYFSEIYEAGGGKVLAQESYTIGAGDFSAVVTKIANASPAPDVIFTPMYPPDTQVFMKQLRDAGVTIPVLSTDGNLDPSLKDAGAKAVDGMVFSASICPASADPKIAKFMADYKAKYGKEPSSEIAALGYDEIKILADVITKADSADPAAIIEGLKSVDFDGITGHVQMDPQTRRANKSVALIKMDGATFTCLPAPSFPEKLPAP